MAKLSYIKGSGKTRRLRNGDPHVAAHYHYCPHTKPVWCIVICMYNLLENRQGIPLYTQLLKVMDVEVQNRKPLALRGAHLSLRGHCSELSPGSHPHTHIKVQKLTQSFYLHGFVSSQPWEGVFLFVNKSLQAPVLGFPEHSCVVLMKSCIPAAGRCLWFTLIVHRREKMKPFTSRTVAKQNMTNGSVGVECS